MQYFLPGQKREWNVDRSISRWRGFVFGCLITIILCAAVVFGWLLPKQQRVMVEAHKEKTAVLESKALALREEVGLLTGVIVSTYHRDAKQVIESYRKKGGK